MSTELLDAELVETDPRFGSGPWTGYWTQPPIRSRGQMDLLLTFRAGQLTGCGRDVVGNFLFKGRYELRDGGCKWVKCYLGKHDVHYEGVAQGKGIIGRWTIETPWGAQAGRFAIWPEGEEEPTLLKLLEEADLPIENSLEAEFNVPVAPEEEPAGVGAGKDDEDPGAPA